jgi:hypothetical protein
MNFSTTAANAFRGPSDRYDDGGFTGAIAM